MLTAPTEKLSLNKYEYFVSVQRYSGLLLCYSWPSSGYFPLEFSLNGSHSKKAANQRKIMRPMDNIAWLHIRPYYFLYESAERTYLQLSSIGSTNIKIWSWSHWCFLCLFFWLFFLRTCLTICSVLTRLGSVKLHFRAGTSSCKIGNWETSDDLGSSP